MKRIGREGKEEIFAIYDFSLDIYRFIFFICVMYICVYDCICIYFKAFYTHNLSN